MNFRRRLVQEPLQFQLAPFIDVVMFLLCFFLLTWNIARYEQDIDVKIPTAKHGQAPERLPGEIIVNVRADGVITLNRREIDEAELQQILVGIVEQYPDQALVLRADESTDYRDIMRVLDAARGADLWNIAFATDRPEEENQ